MLQHYVHKKGKRRSADSDEVAETHTKLGPMTEIEWGWIVHERQARQDNAFKLYDGLLACAVTLQVTLVSFSAAFDPYSISILFMTYVLDVFSAMDVCMTAWRSYHHDLRNEELRKDRCQLDVYFRRRFLIDLLSIAPLEVICYGYFKSNMKVVKYRVMPLLAYLRTNRILCLYKVFRVSS